MRIDKVVWHDKVEWHLDGVEDFADDDELWERAGAHIGYFLEWSYKKGFVPEDPEMFDVDGYQEVINSEITGVQYLIEYCDCTFSGDDLSEQGQRFAEFIYDSYLEDYTSIVGHELYTQRYSQRDMQNISRYFDDAYAHFLANPQAIPKQKEKRSFFQKVKGVFGT